MVNFIEQVIVWAIGLIDRFGYSGIFLTMTLESAAIPIPSEVILPFGGFLVSSGRLNFWLVILAATSANLVGSIIIYYVGFFGGKPLLEKYGKYLLIHRDDVLKMDFWLKRHGARIAFFSRLLPGIRTFSSLVIGAGKVNFNKFFWYTFAGSLVWNLPLTYLGFSAGNNWDFLRPYFRKFEAVILALFVIGIILFIFRHFHRIKKLNRHLQ